MKKLLLLVAVVLAFSFTALAQATSSTGSTGTQAGSEQTTTPKTKKSKKAGGEMGAAGETKAAKTSQVTGCLAKSGDNYTISNAKVKDAAVTSSEDLSAHVGHKVKLSGTWTEPHKAFTATKVTHVSDTCAGGGKMSAKHGKKGAKAGAEGTEATPK